MPWEFTDDVELYAARTWDLLAARPAENTVALTVIGNLRAGRRWSSEPVVLGWYDDGGVSGAVSLTPPYELLLAVVPDRTVGELAAELRARRVRVPGVNGDVATADRFVREWTAGTGAGAVNAMPQRLYVLAELRPPATPGGRPRRAEAQELDVGVRWFSAFQREVGAHAVDVEPTVQEWIEEGRLWLWEDDSHEVVSLAGRQRTAGGVARVGPVYTPHEQRRRGFAAAVTAACSGDALRRGAEHVVLFTDLANPTSNAIYQQIGFRPVRDRTVIRFAAR
ncbi:MAG: GNAT family N-acetyltransferase [Actinomycetota bacterium]|nr:GNAT family N-acetyltransferase [Actinomycetota bacterium]